MLRLLASWMITKKHAVAKAEPCICLKQPSWSMLMAPNDLQNISNLARAPAAANYTKGKLARSDAQVECRQHAVANGHDSSADRINRMLKRVTWSAGLYGSCRQTSHDMSHLSDASRSNTLREYLPHESYFMIRVSFIPLSLSIFFEYHISRQALARCDARTDVGRGGLR